GRLFDETHAVWAETENRYGRRIPAYLPETADVERLLRDQGPLGFRDSVEARQACCHARKVAPLARALRGTSGWITGLRADQSAARADSGFAAWDDERSLWKVNPLLDWSRDEV